MCAQKFCFKVVLEIVFFFSITLLNFTKHKTPKTVCHFWYLWDTRQCYFLDCWISSVLNISNNVLLGLSFPLVGKCVPFLRHDYQHLLFTTHSICMPWGKVTSIHLVCPYVPRLRSNLSGTWLYMGGREVQFICLADVAPIRFPVKCLCCSPWQPRAQAWGTASTGGVGTEPPCCRAQTDQAHCGSKASGW